MKNYKNLIPIVLVVLFLLGIYMKVDANTSLNKEYKGYLTAARQYHEKEIYVDAEKNYLLAAETKPSLKLSVEIGEFYATYNSRKAISWGEETIEQYANEPAGYEFLLKLYKSTEKYEDFYELYSTVAKRGIETKEIAVMEKELRNVFYYEDAYADAGSYAEGYCRVMDDGMWRYIGMTGTKVTGLNYTTAGDFGNGVAAVTNKLGEAYFIDTSGNKKYVVENLENIVVLGSYSDGVCTVFDGKTWGIYTLDGELKYGGYTNVSRLANGVIAVQKENKWTLLDEGGSQLIKTSFDDIKQDDKGVVYRNKRLFAQINGKYYMMDIEGNKIGEGAYDDVRIFNGDGYAAVKIGSKWGFVDADGKLVIEPTYDEARSFSNGYAAVKLGDRWGFIDEDNEIFLEYQFVDVKDFTSAKSVFVVNRGQWKLLRLYSGN